MRKVLLLGLVVCMILNVYINKKARALAASEQKAAHAKAPLSTKKSNA